jgi:hypothetical protein
MSDSNKSPSLPIENTISPKIRAQMDKNDQKQAQIRKEIENMKKQQDLLMERIRIKQNFHDTLEKSNKKLSKNYQTDEKPSTSNTKESS